LGFGLKAEPLKRIGLFGGSFDPPHNAHVALAWQALKQLPLDEVRWIPAGQPWQKSRPLTAAAHRQAMVELAIEGEPRFVLECCEIARLGASYTLDTVRQLQAQAPPDESVQWVLLLGQDQYAGFHTWHGYQALLTHVTLAVANRPALAMQPDEEMPQTPHRRIALEMMNISSTEVRSRLARGENIEAFVPEKVASYIARHDLYKHP
jgi:nicotinate-nucleotide adenylyltransferase